MVILLSVVINLYQVLFFVHGYMRSSQIQIFIGNQLKRSQTKQVLKLHMLCNYVLKENSNEAFPKSRCCSAIIPSCFNKLNKAIVCGFDIRVLRICSYNVHQDKIFLLMIASLV